MGTIEQFCLSKDFARSTTNYKDLLIHNFSGIFYINYKIFNQLISHPSIRWHRGCEFVEDDYALHVGNNLTLISDWKLKGKEK